VKTISGGMVKIIAGKSMTHLKSDYKLMRIIENISEWIGIMKKRNKIKILSL